MNFLYCSKTGAGCMVVILLFMLFSSGCAFWPEEMVLETGRPEIELQSPHLDSQDYRGLIANAYVDKNYWITEQQPYKLTLKSPPEKGYFIETAHYLEFKFIPLRDKTRIIARVYKEEASSLSGNVKSITEVTRQPGYFQPVQDFLKQLRERVINEEAFENLTGISIGISGGEEEKEIEEENNK